MAPAIAPVAPLALEPAFRLLPLTQLQPSSTNPRRHADAAADAQLVDSVRAVGILEPLIVRPRLSTSLHVFEVVAGHRRLAAAQAAGLSEVPALVRDLTDTEALEIAVIENDQRKDVHPLDEAEAFARLQAIGPYSPAAIAAKIGRPTRHVADRLRLLSLVPSVKAAFDADTITLGHAQRLAKLPPTDQAAGLEACFEQQFDYDSGAQRSVLQPVESLHEWIKDQVRLEIGTPEAEEDFPELVAEVTAAYAAGATVLMLDDEWYRHDHKAGDPIPRAKWAESTATEAVLGVIVTGRRRGKTLRVVLNAAPTPARRTTTSSTPKTAADKQAKDAEATRRADDAAKAERRAQVVRTRVLAQVATGVDAQVLTTAPVLRLLHMALAGAAAFDREDLAVVSTALKVDNRVFDYRSRIAGKLPVEKLCVVVAVQALGDAWALGDFDGACKAFGIDLKAIDRAVSKELAASATSKPPKGQAAKAAATKKTGKAAKRR